MSNPSLVILGAGPKAVAVQAKAHALRSLGLPAPTITVVDHQGVGGNWRAGGGWTDGRHQLGTSPTKDVGFPYRTRIAGQGPGNGTGNGTGQEANRAVDRALLDVSWTSFLVATDRYAWWVDHGHPNPRHYLWADYLRWVAARSHMTLVNGQVTRLGLRDGSGSSGWSLSVDRIDGTTSRLEADALMLTGPGRSDRRIAPLPTVYSVAGFWQAVSSAQLPPASRVAVIGGGETAASVVEELIGHDVVDIAVISPTPTIFTRAEGSFENELYTDPGLWSSLDESDRADVINRCDRGVFSAQVQEKLMAEDRVNHVRGRVTGVHGRDGGAGMAEVQIGDRTELVDLVVDARGNSPLWFTRMMNDQVVARLIGACGGAVTPSGVMDRIGADLSLTGMDPTLFLPTVSGWHQGPGLANLSCLGELSDRVLAGLGAGCAPDPESLRHAPSRPERTTL
ncbi:MAG: lysine N(6)-hydroxylase/L-ornithine N(5)-oxygenase family protein [Corynebacterium sp.]|nr:lysine N(6)-hydroxylase/L-ornithine N(5)-oxygenase family protein [Corynebacterium sp.]